MHTQTSSLESIIKDYLEQKQRSINFGKKRLESEKEYNRLLTKYDGEAKHYSLDHADKIYKAYHEMIANGDEASSAQELFSLFCTGRWRSMKHSLFFSCFNR